MAERDDKSLDDFFAKRDKKKKKDKTKVTKGGAAAAPSGPAKAAVSPDSPAPAPDTTATAASLAPVTAPAEAAPVTVPAASKKGRKEKERAAKSECQDPQQEREDEEWKEFEQKEVDYSGLRIHALQISDEREEEDDEKKDDQSEDGENVLYRDGDELAGPWNKMTQIPAPPVVVAEVPESKPSGVYRPPAARSGNVRRTQSQGPPEIFNDAQFPSLQASAKHIETRKDKEMEKTFEMVKYKNRAREDGSKSQSVQLELGNQFAVLGEQ
ncbi:protein CDV3 homolog isoform X1 [Stegostoma tigrinum]|uniref:protein CDV3 homolog isoform X1 n=2 Tax=Stegostoma tigrinum TaxID=3053191 RepID=UPI0028709E75|nr:protein CDV3 homolog isoform X1 [Stegostoma tigrinum]